ncbi:MAG: tetratricopeptide repeat protein [Nannocystaceae bacterium]
MDSVDAVVDRGLTAVEEEDLERALEALDEAQRLVGENHVRVLHLAGLIAWSEGRLENAAGYLQQAVDAGAEQAEIYLDCAECLATSDQDHGEAEAVLRSLLSREGADEEAKDQAHLLLAQLRLEDDDVDDALDELDAISDARKSDPVYLSTRAMVLAAGGRDEEAAGALERAVELEPDDADLHYQLALLRELRGEEAAARASMLRVLELDVIDGEESGYTPLSEKEREALRARFEEDILTEVPDAVLARMATVPILVQRRATREQVAEGVNPRAPIAFHGEPARELADGSLQDGTLRGIIIMRDLLLDEVDSEDDLVPVMMLSLLEELRAFFRLDDLQMASG